MTRSHAGSPGGISIIERFLGSHAAEGGVHALLGLASDDVADDTVISALERCLTRVDQHAQGRTPEADEVRLALHAAAAQLLDRAARKQTSGTPVRVPKGKPSRRHRMLRLEQDAIITLARYGGWNRRSLRRLSMLALARGAQPSDVADVLAHLAGRRRGNEGSPQSAGRQTPGHSDATAFTEPISTAFSTSMADESASEGKPLAVIVGAIATGLALIVAIALVIVALTTSRPPTQSTEEPDNAIEKPFSPPDLPKAGGEELFPWKGKPKTIAEIPDPYIETSTPSFDRLSDALAALDSAPDGLAIDPAQAVRIFDGAFAGVGAQWCNLTQSQQRAAQHDVVEFVYRAVQGPALIEPVINAIARGGQPLTHPTWAAAPDDIWPAAWSVGILARLAHERDIGAVASQAIEDRLRNLVGSSVVVSGGFDQGVQTALWAMLPAIVSGGENEPGDTAEKRWEMWIAATRFGNTDARGVLLAALEWIVVSPEDPSENEAVRSAIESLTLASEWGEGAPSRAWLVRMFADTRVSTADLHALTTTLARRSQAPGVDITMALSVRANADTREALRERYAGVWQIDTAGPSLDDLAADWLAAAREAGNAANNDTTTIDRLATAAAFSRISEAARLRHFGRLDDAGIVIDEYDRPIEIELTTWNQRQRPDRIDTDPGMSRWSLSYLSAQRDFAKRLELLVDAAKLNITHAADAEVLVTEAVRGSPAKARAAARSALLTQQPTAVLTLAMLEIAPRMPRTPQNAALVAALTSTITYPTDAPDWRLHTRRILVQTALEQLAAEGEQGVIDQLAGVLGESYTARAMGLALAESNSVIPNLTPAQSAALLRLQWERLARQGGVGAEALEVEGVLARHASRLGLAEGPVQTFVAEQMAAFELMSIAVASERLDRAGAVRTLRAGVRNDRRHADDIIEQIVIVERAFVELWALRLGQEMSWN